MKIIISNEVAGIIVYTALDYKYEKTYVMCYGLDIKKTNQLPVAMQFYSEALAHARECMECDERELI